MRGKTFEAEVSASLKEVRSKEPYFFYTRLMDAAGPGPRQPADFMAIHTSQPYLFECKSCKQTSFPIANIQRHQVDDLISAEHAGATSFILIKHSCHDPVVYAMRPKVWQSLMRDLKRKSLTWRTIMDNSKVVLKVTVEGHWNLWRLFKQE